MTQARTVAVVVGSLRKDSASRKLAEAFAALAPADLKFDFLEIGELPHFDQDLESDPPAPWTTFRDRVRPADAVLFVTPEYNRSVPGVLKNAIDVGSRPYGQSVWSGKPAGVVSTSPGAVGGFGANHHLQNHHIIRHSSAYPSKAPHHPQDDDWGISFVWLVRQMQLSPAIVDRMGANEAETWRWPASNWRCGRERRASGQGNPRNPNRLPAFPAILSARLKRTDVVADDLQGRIPQARRATALALWPLTTQDRRAN